MQIKFGYLHSAFPWKLAALGHADTALARSAMQECLQMRNAITPTEPIHWFVLVLLFTDPYYTELVNFVGGHELETLPHLLVFACIFRFAFSSELHWC